MIVSIIIGMKVDDRRHAENQGALLTAASRLLRQRGPAALSVAEVSRAAGLTHGALYSHFASKAALTRAACDRTAEQAVARWRSRAARARAAGRDPVRAIIEGYLTEQHRDAPEDGCFLPAAAAELARAEPPLRQALGAGAAALRDVLAAEIAARRPCGEAAAGRAAAATLAAMMGGLLLARALATRPDESRTALAAATALAIAAADGAGGD
jgi:TetR/AcrR family transcriptional repressor of nem operon